MPATRHFSLTLDRRSWPFSSTTSKHPPSSSSAPHASSVDGGELPALDMDCLCSVFSQLPSNCLATTVKLLSKDFKEWVEEQHPPSCSRRVDPRGYLPLWALQQLGVGQLSGMQQRCVLQAAAAEGSAAKIEWLIEQSDELRGSVCTAVARTGNLPLLELLRKKRKCPWGPQTVAEAAEQGHFAVVKWAVRQGCGVNRRACSAAAKGGHLSILQWLRQQGAPWDATTATAAASGGHLQLLCWAHANGCPLNASVCYEAAYSGHLSVLQWARSQGCDWDASLCGIAARNGHLEILRWARKQDPPAPWDRSTWQIASFWAPPVVVEWLRQHGCPGSAVPADQRRPPP